MRRSVTWSLQLCSQNHIPATTSPRLPLLRQLQHEILEFRFARNPRKSKSIGNFGNYVSKVNQVNNMRSKYPLERLTWVPCVPCWVLMQLELHSGGRCSRRGFSTAPAGFVLCSQKLKAMTHAFLVLVGCIRCLRCIHQVQRFT